jgi:hypothetical protein
MVGSDSDAYTREMKRMEAKGYSPLQAYNSAAAGACDIGI